MAYYIQIQKENEIIIKKLYIEEKSSIEDLKFEIKTAEDPSDTAINGLALIMEGKYKLEQEV
jgi:hypothetical protein